MTENPENIYDLPEYKIKIEIEEHHVTTSDQENLDTVQDFETKSNETCVVKEEASEKTIRHLDNEEIWCCPHCSLTFQTIISFKAHIFSTHEPNNQKKFVFAPHRDTFTCKDSFEAYDSQNNSDINGELTSNHGGDSGRVWSSCEELHHGEDTRDCTPPMAALLMDKFQCFDCKETFSSFDSIKAHLRTHTKPKIKTICSKECLCKTCHQRFSSETELLKHIQGLHHPCNGSGMEFIRTGSVESHRLKPGEDAPSLKKPKLDAMHPTTAEVRSATEDPAAADTSTAAVIGIEDYFEKAETTRNIRKKKLGKNSKQKQKKDKNISKHITKKASTKGTATVLKLPGTKTDGKVTCATEKQSECSNNTVIGTSGDIPTCDICGYTTARVINLNSHLKAHAATKRYSCDSCLYLCIKVSHFKSHIRTHTSDEPYSCDVCGKRFAHKRHWRTHTGEKPYDCDVCQKQFSIKSNLDQHMRTHTGKRPYSCDVCGKRFSHKSTLVVHARTHTGDKPYSCEVCAKRISHKQHVGKHLRTHTDEKPYNCDVCQKQFSRKGNLDLHMRTHTGEKPYSCDVCGCGKRFNQKSTLVRHLRTHIGENPYHCDVCQKQFSLKFILDQHMRSHTGEKPYRCDVCGKKFSYRQNLIIHLRQHSGAKPYSCDVCKKSFRQKNHLVYHLRTHTGEKPYSCDVCEKRFSQKSNLITHAMTHR